jgi:hypothetical protein
VPRSAPEPVIVPTSYSDPLPVENRLLPDRGEKCRNSWVRPAYERRLNGRFMLASIGRIYTPPGSTLLEEATM